MRWIVVLACNYPLESFLSSFQALLVVELRPLLRLAQRQERQLAAEVR